MVSADVLLALQCSYMLFILCNLCLNFFVSRCFHQRMKPLSCFIFSCVFPERGVSLHSSSPYSCHGGMGAGGNLSASHITWECCLVNKRWIPRHSAPWPSVAWGRRCLQRALSTHICSEISLPSQNCLSPSTNFSFTVLQVQLSGSNLVINASRSTASASLPCITLHPH